MNIVIRKVASHVLRPVNTAPSWEMLAHLIDAQCVAILLEAWRLQTATGIGHAVDILTSAARQFDDREKAVQTALELLSRPDGEVLTSLRCLPGAISCKDATPSLARPTTEAAAKCSRFLVR
jgi:hypothetical protein